MIVVDIEELSSNIALQPKASLSVPTTVGAIVDLSISAAIELLLMRVRPIMRPPMLRHHELVPSTPRYVLIPICSYYSHTLGIVHRLLVGGGVYHIYCRLL